MKTTNATFLIKQGQDQIQDDFLIYLFEQWDYAITDRDSATQIKIQGDASSWLSDGAVFIIPLDDFQEEHTLTSPPAYDGGTGKTTITCSGSSFGTGIVGLYIALKHDITSDVLKDGFSPIRIATEGETLNSSLADDVQISVDNSEETYWDNDGSSGLFNSGRIFWVHIIFKLKDDDTEFLYFGGTVYLPSVQPISNLQNVEFLCHGHLKELERYPGFRITEENGILPRIPGIILISITEPSEGIIEAIRDIRLTWPKEKEIKNLVINNISQSTNPTPVGWHVIKFQPPNLWQYDYGIFTVKAAGGTNQTLTSKKGHTINIDLPESFDIISHEEWFYTPNRFDDNIDQIGNFEIQYGAGKPMILHPTFDRVKFYDVSAGMYYDRELYANTYDSDEILVMSGINDELYLMSKEPFYGVEFELNSDLDGTISWYYNSGFNTFSALAVTDGTSNLSQNGVVTWNAPSKWLNSDVVINDIAYDDYYIVKLKCTIYTSGSCNMKRLFKYIRLSGEDGSILTIKVKTEHLPIEEKIDQIILRDNASDIMTPCTWKQNISCYRYLKDLLSEAKYSDTDQSLDAIYITAASKKINIFGRGPKWNYAKKITAICCHYPYPFLYGAKKFFLGIENELWSFDYENGYQFLDKLDPYVRVADDVYFKVEIRKLVIDSNDYLQGIAWKNYFDQPVVGQDYSSDADIGRRTPAIVFRSTNLATITEQTKIDDADNSIFTSQEVCWRDGGEDIGIGFQGLGHLPDTVGAPLTWGENVILPLYQFIWHLHTNKITSYKSTSLSAESSALPYQDLPFKRAPGHYSFLGWDQGVPEALCFTLAQKGFVFWDIANDAWIFIQWDGVDYKMASVDYTGIPTELYDTTNYLNQFIAGCYYNFRFYFARMIWDDEGENWPADYSDCTLERIDNDGSNNTTLFAFASDSVEANQSLAIGNEIYCTILDLIYNENDDTIHGCLLDRSDFDYHYFIYDVSNDKLYTSQIGNGFTFDENRQIKEFIYNSDDNKIYAAIVDLRDKKETAFLISAEFTPPSGAPDGSEITLTFETNIVNNEYDISQIICANGVLYGITQPNCYFFQYDESFEPFIFLNDSKEDNFRECLDDLAQMLNMIHSIGPERKFYLKGRESQKDSTTIYEESNYILDSMQPIRSWQHRYDGVEVEWENPMTGEKGVERQGIFGWQRRILKIKNRFIQYPQLAKLIAEIYDDFFSDSRLELQFRISPLWQLDNRDRFQFSHSVNRFDFSALLWWIISEINYDFWGGEMEIKALEIK